MISPISQETLLDLMKRLCRRVHGEDWVVDWEFTLWRCALGQDKVEGVTYGDMATLLSCSRTEGGWWRSVAGVSVFVPYEEWKPLVKQSREGA